MHLVFGGGAFGISSFWQSARFCYFPDAGILLIAFKAWVPIIAWFGMLKSPILGYFNRLV